MVLIFNLNVNRSLISVEETIDYLDNNLNYCII